MQRAEDLGEARQVGLVRRPPARRRLRVRLGRREDEQEDGKRAGEHRGGYVLPMRQGQGGATCSSPALVLTERREGRVSKDQ